MKRLLISLSVICILFSFSGCNSNKSSGESGHTTGHSESSTAQEVTEATHLATTVPGTETVS